MCEEGACRSSLALNKPQLLAESWRVLLVRLQPKQKAALQRYGAIDRCARPLAQGSDPFWLIVTVWHRALAPAHAPQAGSLAFGALGDRTASGVRRLPALRRCKPVWLWRPFRAACELEDRNSTVWDVPSSPDAASREELCELWPNTGGSDVPGDQQYDKQSHGGSGIGQ